MGKKVTMVGLIHKVKRALRERGLRYSSVLGGNNILVLKSSGEYHYLLIQFEELPAYWSHDQRHFNFKIAYAISYEQILNAIDRYENIDNVARVPESGARSEAV
jgi:hypothetical protein